jgi:signal transduction histidine kinase
MSRGSRAFVALIAIVIATLLGLLYAMQGVASGSQTDVGNAISWGLTFSYLLIPVCACAWLLARRFPVAPPRVARHLALHLAAGLLLGALHPFALIWVNSLVLSPRWFVTVAESMLPYLHFWYWQDVILVTLIYAASLFAAQSMHYYRGYQQGILRTVRLEAQLANSNLAALKAQLHPHFLFNALHSISALQLTDAAAAQRMTMLLGDFLRMTLREFDQQQVPLKREIELLECYLAIEKLRFGDRLKFHIDIAPELMTAQVPQLLLQPIVENAVRHAIAPFSAGGELVVRAELHERQLLLEVRDSGPGMPVGRLNDGANGAGLGLANTRARIEQLYGSGHSFRCENPQSGGLRVEMKIPYRPA